jgi:putative oxidoreductase
MAGLERFTDRVAPWAPTVLRVTLGVIMAYHGWQKLTAMTPAGFGNGMLEGLGIPGAVAVAWAVTLIELVGGIALIVGFGTRIAAALIGVILVAATLLVKTDIGLIAGPDAPLPGMELDLALLALAVGIIALGPGKLSIDGASGNDVVDLTVGGSPEPAATTGTAARD